MTSGENRYLHLTWYRLRDDSRDLARIYLDAATELFPAAVPARFGTHEPMQGRFPRDDASTFDRMYREECDVSDLILTGKHFQRGTISGWTNNLESRYQQIDLRIDFAAWERAGTQASFEEFFVEVARRSGSFFASAELNDAMFDTAQVPAVRGAWAGLPLQPQWLCWFSPEYAALVAPHLAAGETAKYAEGLFHRWTEEPAEAAEIRSWLLDDPWVPYELLPAPNPGNTRRPHEQAFVMPESLRAPVQGSPEWRRIEAYYSREI